MRWIAIYTDMRLARVRAGFEDRTGLRGLLWRRMKFHFVPTELLASAIEPADFDGVVDVHLVGALGFASGHCRTA